MAGEFNVNGKVEEGDLVAVKVRVVDKDER